MNGSGAGCSDTAGGPEAIKRKLNSLRKIRQYYTQVGIRGVVIVEKIGRGGLVLILEILNVIVIVLVPVLEINGFLYRVNILEFNKSLAEFILNPGKVLSKGAEQRQQTVNLRVLALWVKSESYEMRIDEGIMTSLTIIFKTHLVNWSTGIMACMPCCLVKAVPGGWCPHTLNRLSADTPMARHPFCFMMEA